MNRRTRQQLKREENDERFSRRLLNSILSWVVVDRSFVFCQKRNGTKTEQLSSSSSSLDDDDDGDEMIGASLEEEDAPSHRGKPTTGERQTTTFFRTTQQRFVFFLE
mmetsp:Transcript_8261/g.26385  ORF Transcript_8261/g.26385 Transcript_8261/m.26385 type:complete len:107 (+) Transcript_8261:2738-3058(+)